jgi:lipopolysaccharide/colanic/teichoic acid biosynthesis glycosyltransferase
MSMDTATATVEALDMAHAGDASVALPARPELELVQPAAPALPREESRDWRATADAALKRALDITVAGLALLVLLPVVVAAVILVRIDSPGPAFFRCDRAGFRGRMLQMLKFRKMHDGASGRALTTDDDDRFTRIGVWLAKTKLDELPQLWHVLKGEMSLVGPRPEDLEFVRRHSHDYDEILAVRPGITGLSQLAFAEESAILDDVDPLGHYVERLLPQKVGLDRMYARRRNLGLDLRILFWTVAAVLLRRQVAVHRDTGKMNLRRR